MVADLATACDRVAPLEAAGFLLGVRRAAILYLNEILVLGDTAGRGDFQVADHELRRARAWAAERGLEIAALFHSHPGGSLALSNGDRAGLRHSEWPWLIVARGSGKNALRMTAYRAGDGRRLAARDFRLEVEGRASYGAAGRHGGHPSAERAKPAF